MQILKANFEDFDIFNEAVSDWELDFKLMSKNDFSAYLNMFTSDTFSLSRIKLHGKIEQKGLIPAGTFNIVIPANYNSDYYWLNKEVSGKELLIFPKNRILDAVSFNDFDNYVITVEETMLNQIIENLGYNNCRKLFNGNEQEVFLSKAFSKSFHQVANKFLNTQITNVKRHNALIHNIIHFVLRYIEDSNQSIISIPHKKKDVALRKAIDIINNQQDDLFSVQQLCGLTGVSERTLQYAFHDKYKVSPSDYIKAVRLNNVKRELFLAKGQNINISSVAGKYCFWHMGQFAKDFKSQFGILPSEVLNI